MIHFSLFSAPKEIEGSVISRSYFIQSDGTAAIIPSIVRAWKDVVRVVHEAIHTAAIAMRVTGPFAETTRARLLAVISKSLPYF